MAQLNYATLFRFLLPALEVVVDQLDQSTPAALIARKSLELVQTVLRSGGLATPAPAGAMHGLAVPGVDVLDLDLPPEHAWNPTGLKAWAERKVEG